MFISSILLLVFLITIFTFLILVNRFINLSTLKISFNQKVKLKITDSGEVLVCDLILTTGLIQLDIDKIKLELLKIDGINQFLISSSESESVKCHISNLTTSGLICKINLDYYKSQIINEIRNYTTEIFNYAKSVEYKKGNVTDDYIRRSFLDIKDKYIISIYNKTNIKQGDYKVFVEISYVLRFLKFLSLSKKSRGLLNFTIDSNPYKIIDLDNFLGVMLSNILFSPASSLNLIEPEYSAKVKT